ncbi:MAG: hypothetical protein ABIA74_04580 [bacterium]
MVKLKKIFLIFLLFFPSLKSFEVVSKEMQELQKILAEKKSKLQAGEQIYIGKKPEPGVGTGAGVGTGSGVGAGAGVGGPEAVISRKPTKKPVVKPEKKELTQNEKNILQTEIIKIFKDVRTENLIFLSSNGDSKNPPNPLRQTINKIKEIKNVNDWYLEKIIERLNAIPNFLKIESLKLFKFKNNVFEKGKELDNTINLILNLFKDFVANFSSIKIELTKNQSDYDLQSSIVSFIINAKAYEKSQKNLSETDRAQTLSDDTLILLFKSINDSIKKDPDDQNIRNIFFNFLNILRMSDEFVKSQDSLFKQGTGPTGAPAVMLIALNQPTPTINLATFLNSLKQCFNNPGKAIKDLKTELSGKTDSTDQEAFETLFNFLVAKKEAGTEEEKEIKELIEEIERKRSLPEEQKQKKEALIAMQTMFEEAKLERKLQPKIQDLINKISKIEKIETLETILSELKSYYEILQLTEKEESVSNIFNSINSIKANPLIEINQVIEEISKEFQSINPKITISTKLTEAFVNLYIKHIFLLMIPKYHYELLKNIWYYLPDLIKENLTEEEKRSLNLNYDKLQTENIYSINLNRNQLITQITNLLEIDKIQNKDLKEKIINFTNLALNTICNLILGLEVDGKTFEDFIIEKASLIPLKRAQNVFLISFYNYPWLFGLKSIKPIIGIEYKNIEPFFKFINPYGLLLLILQAATSDNANLFGEQSSLFKMLKYFETKQTTPIETIKLFIEKATLPFKDDEFKDLKNLVPPNNQLPEYSIYLATSQYISDAIKALEEYDVENFVLNLKKYLQETSLSFFEFEKNLATELQKKLEGLKTKKSESDEDIDEAFKFLLITEPPKEIQKIVTAKKAESEKTTVETLPKRVGFSLEDLKKQQAERGRIQKEGTAEEKAKLRKTPTGEREKLLEEITKQKETEEEIQKKRLEAFKKTEKTRLEKIKRLEKEETERQRTEAEQKSQRPLTRPTRLPPQPPTTTSVI